MMINMLPDEHSTIKPDRFPLHLMPLNIDGASLPQPVHLVVHPLQLLVPRVLQALPHLLVLGPPGLQGLQELAGNSADVNIVNVH